MGSEVCWANEKPNTTKLRRYHAKNADYFLTLVTYKREALLHRDIGLFWASWGDVMPDVWVILPDYLHVIINNRESPVSDLVHRFKIRYSRRYRDRYRPGSVWQRRFWDHVIRDQQDMDRHLDYIHYNPVRHGLTEDSLAYEHSPIHVWFKKGYYQPCVGLLASPCFARSPTYLYSHIGQSSIKRAFRYEDWSNFP